MNADVFVCNVPRNISPQQLKKQLRPHCTALGIYAYDAHLFPGRSGTSSGTITFDSTETVEKFLKFCGKMRFSQPHITVQIGQCCLCFRPSNKPTRDLYLVQSLFAKQQEALKAVEAAKVRSKDPIKKQTGKKEIKKFDVLQLDCGIWSPESPSRTAFEPQYSLQRTGSLTFRHRAIILQLDADMRIESKKPRIMVAFLHSNILLITMDNSRHIILTLRHPPRVYRQSQNPADTQLGELTGSERATSIDDDHACFIAISFVYRIALRSDRDRANVLRLGKKDGNPPISTKNIPLAHPTVPFETAVRGLFHQLRSSFEFCVAFQLSALFSNGFMSPQSLLELLPKVRVLTQTIGAADSTIVLQGFVNDLRYFGAERPEGYTEAKARLEFCVRRHARLRMSEKYAKESSENPDMVWVHHATITPSGCYFWGPRLEASNRVLRKYNGYRDYFLRVTFTEEDTEMFLHEPGVSNDNIFNDQFLRYLEPSKGGLVIAGRVFSFLGFSSSSLRSQASWFMAPFHHDGELLTAAKLIDRLGDFSSIRNPGRYMARVGQAFSDTLGSIHVPLNDEAEVPDVKRLDKHGVERVFTDGIGKISQQMVERIWDESERIGLDEPTVFQIRFAGAKGVVCLDPSLRGDKLCLRRSMIKFSGSQDRNIEICSWAKRLPMFLNRIHRDGRPLIKVLEDLKIPASTFLHLQREAVNQLREAGTSAAHAANFLKRQHVSSQVLRIWWVVEVLKNLGIDFRQDDFLEQVFELSLLMVLRDIKYRARIPVPNGLTLIGVVDETGYLKEGQVYCTSTTDGKTCVTTGKVMITRSPVHHPGDVQMVNAVYVPRESPLNLLKNCVVFSRNGDRDLPSMLAGGDLDGDLYNIIYDPRFNIEVTYTAAEHPRVSPVELDHPVEQRDVVNFFLDFMRNNLLGLIANRHLLIADQMREGIFHPDCLKLAEMHSTAVDFPKTGRQVNRKDFPRCSRARPDFMAPGPRFLVAKDKVVHEMTQSRFYDEDDEDDEEMGMAGGMATVSLSFYASHKVLGQLYRQIDETNFLESIHLSATSIRENRGSVLERLWNFLVHETNLYAWRNYLDDAKDLRERYESTLTSLCWDYSDRPWEYPLKEVEVFIGSIVGTDRQSKRQREASVDMSEDFDRLATSTVYELKGTSREETLGKAMACLFLCLPQSGIPSKYNSQSFAWVTAGVLLTEVDKMQKEKKQASRR